MSNPSVILFRAALTELSRSVRSEVHNAMLKTAGQIAARMRAAAPKRTGNLARSIRVVDRSTDVAVDVAIVAGGKLTTKSIGDRTYSREIVIGSSNTSGAKKKKGGKHVTYDYVRATEFGTVKESPEPFFYPTMRASMRSVQEAQGTALNAAINKGMGD